MSPEQHLERMGAVVEVVGEAKPRPLIQSSAAFIAGFKPPDYLFDGVLQRRFIYSLTAPTGSGKTSFLLLLAASTAQGTPISGRDMQRGRVIYFAGENPDDVRMRWIVMAERMGFDVDRIDVHFIPGTFSIPDLKKRIWAEARQLGGFALAIIDTSAAYFQGGDENSNTEMGKHARQLRELTTLPGEPCVIVACHPVKNAGNDNLLPRGGGAFIAEMDGNLIGKKNDSLIDLHWQGKFRGPDFEPMAFRLETVTSERLKDSRGRRIPTVMASPIAEWERTDMTAETHKREDQIILLLDKAPSNSMAGMAEALGWISSTGKPLKSRVERALKTLRADRMVTQKRNIWELTKEGRAEADRLKAVS